MTFFAKETKKEALNIVQELSKIQALDMTEDEIIVFLMSLTNKQDVLDQAMMIWSSASQDSVESKKKVGRWKKSMELKNLIKSRLDAREEERNKAVNSYKEFNVQYSPCGHVRRIRSNEPNLLAKVEKWAQTHYDAYTRPSEECPLCKRKLIDSYLDYYLGS